jgi:hypothetical protein
MVSKNTNPDTTPEGNKGVAADAAETARLQCTLTGRDIIKALAGSPLAEVTFERLSVRSKVRDIEL